MIQPQIYVNVTDNSGARELMCIRIIRVSNRQYANIDDIIVVVIKKAVPNMTLEKSEVVRVVVVRTCKELKRDDGIIIRYDDNAAVMIDHKKNTKGTRIFGEIPEELKKVMDRLKKVAGKIITHNMSKRRRQSTPPVDGVETSDRERQPERVCCIHGRPCPDHTQYTSRNEYFDRHLKAILYDESETGFITRVSRRVLSGIVDFIGPTHRHSRSPMDYSVGSHNKFPDRTCYSVSINSAQRRIPDPPCHSVSGASNSHHSQSYPSHHSQIQHNRHSQIQHSFERTEQPLQPTLRFQDYEHQYQPFDETFQQYGTMFDWFQDEHHYSMRFPGQSSSSLLGLYTAKHTLCLYYLISL